ncbi:1-(5-phosphoribosyl)-5-[(5-phosphoribosylamino) methylideneamino] imidazole-4-carboxamide isomerase [Arenicella chitinivorans]|uniref:1-(5-phosphoribosyl)-5-[(5-phosphoribosylamino)methylideneamino] imidazole-4-carboxamide isomerase n=1 Tax=Arenicella chitinivorans TaxID=1329800 RepID=A0A918RU79_9GAMM|nr:1-(5-phosphoribosyl)-5-[(5-phosphoribosylamino)methylideneamino]imidazole-4-carboxamide isomerase [Arenicella chitinivorans]GHA13007.1 1-(5-phosphoribosyl)-5-[(5-phosphoribosylamino) methylideneamino] imidazole-4-carboxamide isomerase [Arenicella chitinivorans]
MLLIPAIDIKEGKCVRLRQGLMEDSTVFSDSPLAMAEKWVELGARRLHLVDLDGAFAGKPANAGVINQIAKAFPEVPIQIGGGIRDESTIQAYLDVGVQYAIIGTRAAQEPEFIAQIGAKYGPNLIIGLDAKNGIVAIDGWATMTEHNVVDLAKQFEADGVQAIVYTDIERDGMMQGVNLAATQALAESVSIPIIASGGVTNLDDLVALQKIELSGVSGVITGRAIYEGSLDFAAGQAYLDSCAS